jgi:hypothetical protein
VNCLEARDHREFIQADEVPAGKEPKRILGAAIIDHVDRARQEKPVKLRVAGGGRETMLGGGGECCPCMRGERAEDSQGHDREKASPGCRPHDPAIWPPRAFRVKSIICRHSEWELGQVGVARIEGQVLTRRQPVSLGVLASRPRELADFCFRDADLREPQRRKEDIVKLPGLRKVGYPKVNVIETVDTHAVMFATATAARNRRSQSTNSQ